MGYALNRFTETPNENIICGVCSAALERAVIIPCGHSFCLTCLETWLARPCTNTCPECRSLVMISEATPVHSIRNLVLSLNSMCEYADRGCAKADRLERILIHQNECGFSPVSCTACDETVNRVDLPCHQIECPAIAAVINEDVTFDTATNSSRTKRRSSSKDSMNVLRTRVITMESQLCKIKLDLVRAENSNRNLEVELRCVKKELEEQRNMIRHQQRSHGPADDVEAMFEPNYDYGYTPQSVIRLSKLVCRHLHDRPPYIDKNRLFVAIKRCYEHYGRFNNGQYIQDVHMLVATCNASNWFTASQKDNFEVWLEAIFQLKQK